MKPSKRIDRMHKYFGELPDKTCGECVNFTVNGRGNRTVFKCEVYGNTFSEATDWRKGYTACGMVNIPYKGKMLMPEMILSERSAVEEEQIEGQMTIFDYIGEENTSD